MRLRCEAAFYGLIQHSFALRMQGDWSPYNDIFLSEALSEIFTPPPLAGVHFKMYPASSLGDGAVSESSAPASHSPLVKSGLTTLEPQEIPFLRRDGEGMIAPLPKPLEWAQDKSEEESWERFIFASNERRGGTNAELNDFLIESGEPDQHEQQAYAASRVLCQVLAHRRSMLFGLSLASRFFNVMLPHARLTPVSAPASEMSGQTKDVHPTGSWILQPLVSVVRAGEPGGGVQRTFSLTFFLIPVDSECADRKMPTKEIASAVQAEWNLASSRSPQQLRRFHVGGPLPTFVAHVERVGSAPVSVAGMGVRSPGETAFGDGHGPFTLRQEIEATLFAVALRMAHRHDGHRDALKRRIGDDVVTSLGNSRVSSVVAVDPKLTKVASRLTDSGKLFPGSLGALMAAIAGENRVAPSKRYRIDRPFYDSNDSTMGVLPANRCIVFTTAKREQRASQTSGLMQAGWIAYMAIGASVAISTMRSIYRELERRVDLSEPRAVARIEREVAVDLDEIYDLDITWEAYRHRYRLLRDRLGITSDYEALHSKLQAFYRETEARFEDRSQKRLVWLTAAIVVLSVLILIGTIVVAAKGQPAIVKSR